MVCCHVRYKEIGQKKNKEFSSLCFDLCNRKQLLLKRVFMSFFSHLSHHFLVFLHVRNWHVWNGSQRNRVSCCGLKILENLCFNSLSTTERVFSLFFSHLSHCFLCFLHVLNWHVWDGNQRNWVSCRGLKGLEKIAFQFPLFNLCNRKQLLQKEFSVSFLATSHN